MSISKPAIKMPELLVFAKLFVVGFVSAAVFRATFYLSAGFAQELDDIAVGAKVVAILAGLVLCLVYAGKRGAFVAATRMGRSRRLDLLMAIGCGVWSNELALP